MKLLEINPFDLIPNPWNSNRVDRENFEKLKISLRSLSCFKPIIVREHADGYQIVGGYHRNEAAKELGFPKVPIINLGNLDDDRAKEISLVDNTRYGEDDTEALSKLLDSFDTDLLVDILPDLPETIELPDAEKELESLSEELGKFKEEDGETKTLKFRLEIDKAEEIETVLSLIAEKKKLKYPDGYSNYSEALYHALVLDKA